MSSTPLKHILIIDDEESICQFMTGLLEGQGYCVTSAANGKEGLEVIRQQQVDLAIVDLFMPVMDGLETVQEIARIAPEVKMITISGWDPHSEDDILAATIDLYVSRRLVKPFTHTELLAAVRECGL